MTMASKLNNNLSLLWSKHALSFQRNIYLHSKTLKFGLANPTFSPLKLKPSRLNSISSSKTISSVFSGEECKGVTINSRNHPRNPFEVLKSKWVSVLMGSCLIFGVMIGFQRPALALPWSFQLPSMNTIDLDEIEDVASELVFAFGFFLLGGLFLFGLSVHLQSVHNSLTSIFTIQMGLVVGDDVRRDLSLISESFWRYRDSSVAWKTILEDIIEVLDWHQSELVFGYSSGKTFFNRRDIFKSLSYRERKRFDRERPVNLRNLNTNRVVGRRRTDGLGNKFVVTILMEFQGWHRLPTMSKRRDLDELFKKVKSYTSKLSLQGLEIVWAPKEGDESFTVGEMKNYYPLLKPL